MSEQTVWQRFSRIFAIRNAHVVRVENPADPGTPDVNWCMDGIEGWVELKQAKNWPKKKDTDLNIKHFSTKQKVWLTKRSFSGGRIHLLLKVSTDWLLFKGIDAAKHLNSSTKEELFEIAQATWSNGLNDEALRRELKK